MATEYAFDIASDLKTVQALELLSRHISGLTLTWNGKNRDYLVGSTINISVSEQLRSWQETILEGFGFTPTLSVGFRFHNNTDFDAFSEIMFQATMLLLEHAEDAVLLFNYEIIVLQRLGGKLVFNAGYQMWDDDWLKSRLSLPFERRPLPSPLL
ncbi:SitI3 family protein [Archangium sp.]|uniref:SitI3 family protein n=1 Tax=Archangium sp. TaxID=1872627 RepID=UPI00286D4B67|nr:SitI3 family protein [Archangium sp.]